MLKSEWDAGSVMVDHIKDKAARNYAESGGIKVSEWERDRVKERRDTT